MAFVKDPSASSCFPASACFFPLLTNLQESDPNSSINDVDMIFQRRQRGNQRWRKLTILQLRRLFVRQMPVQGDPSTGSQLSPAKASSLKQPRRSNDVLYVCGVPFGKAT